MVGQFIRFCTFILLCWSAYGRHLDNERDYTSCPPGQIPVAIKNSDGFLKLTCIPPRCEDIKKVQAICAGGFTNGCPKGHWVGGLHREFKGTEEKAEYKTKCCSHPIFQKTIAIKPQPDFQPGAEAKDPANGQSDLIDIITNVLPNSQFDHHSVEVTTVSCSGSTTTQRSTVRPSTQKPKSSEKRPNNNNNGNNANAGGGGGGGGTNNGNNGGQGGNNGGNHGGNSGGKGGNHGGNSGGKHGGSNENCGPTGCQPKLEGGSEQHYEKQNVPLPGKPPASASDPKAWGIDTMPGHGGAGGGGGGCFSADTLVHTRTGPKRMDEIQVGDEVLSSTSWDGNSAVSYQPITQFIHKDPNVHTRYTVISTASGRSLSLTPYHLLPQFECHLLNRPAVSVREYEILFTQSAKFANRARAGQCLLVVNSEGKLVAERISNVTSSIRQGVFSPITTSGIIVANGVQASCYSSVENHALQHAFFTFVNKVSQAWKPYLDYAGQFFTSTPVQDDGQIPYLLRVMLVLSNLVVGSF